MSYAIGYGFGKVIFIWLPFILFSLVWLIVAILKKKKRKLPCIALGISVFLLIVTGLVGAVKYSEYGSLNSKAKDYTYQELSDVIYSAEEYVSEKIDGLNDVELYGISEDTKEKDLHYWKIYKKYLQEAMKDCEIKQGTIVTVSGYVGLVREIEKDNLLYDAGKIAVLLNKSTDSSYGTINCRTNDGSFLSIKENTPIKIRGVFMKKRDGISGSIHLSDCEIVSE